ncbi:transferrin receptor protein 1-like [Genypterus blacodes]|uniref:transferrin receptor protein 1-like n=1 Tax=Genypterus blacodes TaxID=154954 RepID=UPI003F76F197
MDRLRTAFNKMVNSERYSRFTLQPEDGGGTHMEVTLSDDPVDHAEDQDQDQDQVRVRSGPGSLSSPPQHRSRQTLCFMALGILLIFTIGYSVGYVSHRKPEGRKEEAEVQADAPPPPPPPPAPEAQMDWKDVSKLLSQKLTSRAFEETLRDFDVPRRSAGSEGDARLGNQIFDQFEKLQMKPWTDVHYVPLPAPDGERPNRVLLGSEVFLPQGYLAYSATGSVPGKLVYGNYGRQVDLSVLERTGVELRGCVMLLRAGRLGFPQQVANAAAKGASAVLVYPDPQDYSYDANTPLYGHVHLGSGDPYTPGFPSFNHTQFPPTRSSGLPAIPAQTITAQMAAAFLKKMGGPEAEVSSGFKGGIPSAAYTLGGVENATVEVNNVLVAKEIHNVFGVIRGLIDPDRFVVLGAQRDAWGSGSARATVGTAILTELAKAVSQMVQKDGFKPKRSLVFASWSAGEFGSVGATEWLEGYVSSLDRCAVSYISLDGAVMGRGSLAASASPLLYGVLESAMRDVQSPLGSGSVYDMVGGATWESSVLRPMSLEDASYPFLASSGIPSVSFHFTSQNADSYPYYGTTLDDMDHLGYETNHRSSEMAAAAGRLAGAMALRLVHDHLLPLDVSRYGGSLTKAVVQVYKRVTALTQLGQLEGVSPDWMNSARGSFQRAAAAIKTAAANIDVRDKEACRILNDRIMRVEHNLLSAYVSPVDVPFRHLLLGRGTHTLAAIAETTDMKLLHIELALASWSLQGCANAMTTDIWDLNNHI